MSEDQEWTKSNAPTKKSTRHRKGCVENVVSSRIELADDGDRTAAP